MTERRGSDREDDNDNLWCRLWGQERHWSTAHLFCDRFKQTCDKRRRTQALFQKPSDKLAFCFSHQPTHQQTLPTVEPKQLLAVTPVHAFGQKLLVVLIGVNQIHQRLHITAVETTSSDNCYAQKKEHQSFTLKFKCELLKRRCKLCEPVAAQ